MRVRRAGSRLFAAYAAASLVPVIALGAVLLVGAQAEALDRGLNQGRAQAAVIEEMAIAPALSGEDLAEGLTLAERERLQSATDLAIFSGSVARLRLRSFDGEVAFSDDGSKAGALPSSSPGFQTAVDGGIDVAVLRDPVVSPGHLIRVLQPLVPNTSGRSTGVLEVYLPYDAIAEATQAEMRVTVWRLVAGLGCLYAVLALISWSTTHSLRRHAAQREHQALHDGLTGLPNRESFRITAEEAVERGRQGESGAIVLADLDRFKQVNDTLGHHAGDELLRVVARRLQDSLRTDDTVARLGGDEFGLVLPRSGDRSGVVALLARVREELARDIELDSVLLSVEASFGIAFYPDDADSVEGLLQCADAAMYQGKRGTSGIVVYEPAADARPSHSLSIQYDLRRALDSAELVLHYQPKIDLATGEVSGVEALIRWQHPERGLLAPAEFLSAVEQSGLIEPLTAWVLRRALNDQASWSSMGMSWPVSVNVSARNLESTAFPALVAGLLTELGAASHQLHVEVTETALAVDSTVAAWTVTALANQGLAIAIDDFGIGYTSMSQLRTLPVSELKIDKLFVGGLERCEQDRAIVRSIIGLAHGLGCRVTAEGVENEEVARWLTNAGCDHAQGYFFARPQPWKDLMQRFSARADTRLAAVPSGGGIDNHRERSTT